LSNVETALQQHVQTHPACCSTETAVSAVTATLLLHVCMCLQRIPNYPDIIRHPMDFRTAREKVRTGAYRSLAEWRADMQRIWDNARTFNEDEDHPITRKADKMEAVMERRMEEAVAAAGAAAIAAVVGPAAVRPAAVHPAAAAAAAAGAADVRGNPAKRVRFVSSSSGGGAGVPAAAIAAAAAGAAAGSMVAGVDYRALEQLSNSKEAKQLGTSGGHLLLHWQCSRHVQFSLHVVWQQMGACPIPNSRHACICIGWCICFALILPAVATALALFCPATYACICLLATPVFLPSL
jgi:hypothetical protein